MLSLLRANPTKWSNTLDEVFECVWPFLWDWRLKSYVILKTHFTPIFPVHRFSREKVEKGCIGKKRVQPFMTDAPILYSNKTPEIITITAIIAAEMKDLC